MYKHNADNFGMLQVVSDRLVKKVVIVDTLDEAELVCQEMQQGQLEHDWSIYQSVYCLEKSKNEVFFNYSGTVTGKFLGHGRTKLSKMSPKVGRRTEEDPSCGIDFVA